MMASTKITQGHGDDDVVGFEGPPVLGRDDDGAVLVSPADLVDHGAGVDRNLLLVQELLPDVEQGLVAILEAGVGINLVVVAPGFEGHVVDVVASCL